jgi:hypothetical protein
LSWEEYGGKKDNQNRPAVELKAFSIPKRNTRLIELKLRVDARLPDGERRPPAASDTHVRHEVGCEGCRR